MSRFGHLTSAVMLIGYDCKTQSQGHWSFTSSRIVKNNIEVDIQLLGLLEPDAEGNAKYKIEPESWSLVHI